PHPPHLHSFPTRRSSDLVPLLVDLLRLCHGGPHRVGFWILSVRNCQNTSNIPRSAAEISEATITATVAARVSAQPGQLTLRSSSDRKSTRLNSSHVAISY